MKLLNPLVCLLTLLSFQAYPQTLPTSIPLNGLNYNANYTSVNPSTTLVTLYSDGVARGGGELTFTTQETQGRIAIGPSVFSVDITKDFTHIVPLLSLPEPPPNSRDCLTNDTTKVKAQLAKLAKVSVKSQALPVTINIAILYTPAAAITAGGVSNMLSKIQASIVEANQTYTNSGINIVLNLVYSGPLQYTEATPGSLETDLLNIETNITAQTVRATYGADIETVMVSSTDPNYAGMSGGYNGDPAHGYNVVQAIYAVGNFVVPHEVGHNLGCDHDRANTCYNAAFPYSYGDRFTLNNLQWRTVMSYPPGIQVGYFSGPNVKFQGVPTGDTNNNNADTINLIAPIVATFHTPLPNFALTLTSNGSGTIAQDGIANTTGTIIANRIQPIRLSALGNFVCISVNNQLATVSQNIVVLTVKDPPVITQQPTKTAIPLNQSGAISISATGRNPLTYQWYRNSIAIDGANNATYIINSMTTNNTGTYFVKISNADGSLNSSNATVTLSTNTVNSNAKVVQTPTAITYNGLFYETNTFTPDHAGAVSLTISNAQYAGIITIGNTSYQIQGNVKNNQILTSFQRPTATAVAFVCSATSSNLTGTLTDGNWEADLYASSEEANKLPTKTYTLEYNSSPNGELVITNGTANLSLNYPIALKQTCPLNKDGFWPVYTPNAIGWMQVTTTNVIGTLVWYNATNSTTLPITGQP